MTKPKPRRKSRPSKPAARSDSWRHRSPRTPRKIHDFDFPRPELQPEVCATMFRQDDFARRIVKTIVEDAMRQGFAFVDQGEGADEDDAKALNAACKRWDLGALMTEAAIWGRCFGAGFIMLGIRGQDPSEPLDDETIGEGDLVTLDVYDRRDVVPYDYYTDTKSPKLGQVERYRLQSISAVASQSLPVHETRLIKFGGVLTSRRERIENGDADDSVLNCIFDVIEGTNASWKSILALMADFAQGVFKIKDLVKILAQNAEGVLETRMRLMDERRSSERAILLDADKEDFERKATPIAGAAELQVQAWQRLAAAAEMSVTKLMGMSPAGLNATGESDRAMDYDRTQGFREHVLTPRIERLGRVIARSEGIAEPDDLAVQFPSLWQMSPIQEADVRLKWGQLVEILVDKGVILPEEAAVSGFGKGKWSPEISIDLAARQAMLAKELAAAQENAGKTPPAPAIPDPNAPPPQEN